MESFVQLAKILLDSRDKLCMVADEKVLKVTHPL